MSGNPAPSRRRTARAALLTRVDRKYLLTTAEAEVVLAAVAALHPLVLDIDGTREFAYESVYFDTPDLLSYRLAAHDRRRRFKLRTRGYLDTDGAFLELKTRGSRSATVKDRFGQAIAYDASHGRGSVSSVRNAAETWGP